MINAIPKMTPCTALLYGKRPLQRTCLCQLAGSRAVCHGSAFSPKGCIRSFWHGWASLAPKRGRGHAKGAFRAGR